MEYNDIFYLLRVINGVRMFLAQNKLDEADNFLYEAKIKIEKKYGKKEKHEFF